MTDVSSDPQPWEESSVCEDVPVDYPVDKTPFICDETLDFMSSCNGEYTTKSYLPLNERLVGIISRLKNRSHELDNKMKEYDELTMNTGSDGEGLERLRHTYEEWSMSKIAILQLAASWEKALKDLSSQ